MAEFKDRLKQLRLEYNMTQTMLSKRLNYGYTAVANYEAGRTQPSIDILKQLADIFNTSVDYLVGASDKRLSNERITRESEMYCIYEIILHLDKKRKEELFSFAEWLLFKS